MTGRATFAAGCFWHVEEAFRSLKGVTTTTVGYTGGVMRDPTYKDVCSGRTHHAEAVLVEYDPGQITYEDLLQAFWGLHDPSQLNRQGPDIGEQYRSAIFYHTEAQRASAEASKGRLQANEQFKNRRVVTEIMPAAEFFPAEEYHQLYFEKRGMKGCRYC
ncbi:MAG: peptide-methionine (S)-S-oxide reductase [Euryarchaeota archaeon RBG_19FT_COMBO_56_21]|nr:MAG: peptide-methionine (S)-S-oxide reductase [Euryarchaeota archaeon RBG_19FT_COMBO_56_21]